MTPDLIIILINNNQWTSVIIGFRFIKCFSFIVRIVFLILSIFGINISCRYAIYLFHFHLFPKGLWMSDCFPVVHFSICETSVSSRAFSARKYVSEFVFYLSVNLCSFSVFGNVFEKEVIHDVDGVVFTMLHMEVNDFVSELLGMENKCRRFFRWRSGDFPAKTYILFTSHFFRLQLCCYPIAKW